MVQQTFNDPGALATIEISEGGPRGAKNANGSCMFALHLLSQHTLRVCPMAHGIINRSVLMLSEDREEPLTARTELVFDFDFLIEVERLVATNADADLQLVLGDILFRKHTNVRLLMRVGSLERGSQHFPRSKRLARRHNARYPDEKGPRTCANMSETDRGNDDI